MTVVTVVLLSKLLTKLKDLNNDSNDNDSKQQEIQHQRNVIIILSMLLVVIPYVYFFFIISRSGKDVHLSYSVLTVGFIGFLLLLLLTELSPVKIYFSIFAVCMCCIMHLIATVNLLSMGSISTKQLLKSKNRKVLDNDGESSTVFVKQINNTEDILSKKDDIERIVIKPIEMLVRVNNFIQQNFTSDNLQQLNNIINSDSLDSLINYNPKQIESKTRYFVHDDSDLTLQNLANKMQGVQDENSRQLLEAHKNIRSYWLIVDQAFAKYANLLQSVRPLSLHQNLSSLKNEIMSTLKKGNNSQTVDELERLLVQSYSFYFGSQI